MEIQEDLEEDLLHHGHKLLEQLGLKVGGPCTTARLETVQHIMERDFYHDPEVQEVGYCLPDHLIPF